MSSWNCARAALFKAFKVLFEVASSEYASVFLAQRAAPSTSHRSWGEYSEADQTTFREVAPGELDVQMAL